MLVHRVSRHVAALIACASIVTTHTAEVGTRNANAPEVAAASNEGENAMRGFQLPPGFKAEVIAAEPHIANPVSFYIANDGKIYVTETFRHSRGVTDIRGKDTWLDEDLAARTVEDRLAMLKRHERDNIANYSKHSDRIKLLVDQNGDGKVDASTVFADGFNHPLDGIGAGVLEWKGNVWYANLPNLWLLRDQNSDGVADWRKSLHHGYGVRIGFLGHDLHGLTFGPDGKVYFTIGDRGANIPFEGKHVGDPDSGAVFRCNPDGSGLEMFSFGLRNPQEIAFDDFGNLFTVDNNSDGGDRARLTYLAEGGDSGWRVGYQFNDWPNPRGPWNREKLWHPRHEGQSAHHLAPLTNITDGPSGLAHYPGVGLPAAYKDHFFIVDFHGGRGSGIMSLNLKPNGASFTLDKRDKFVWEALPTDADFGLDGGLYFVDWVQGWSMTGKGRVYRVYEEQSASDPLVAESKRLLKEGFARKSVKELASLLSHPHKRVRQEAQFELAGRGQASVSALQNEARSGKTTLSRVHATWALGQILARPHALNSRQAAEVAKALMPLLRDNEPEVAAQATKVLGEANAQEAFEAFISNLNHASPRVQYHSALALGKLGRSQAFPALVALLERNADKDEYIRHAAVMGLLGLNEPDALIAATEHQNKSVRLGVLLALRRLQRAEIANFLDDADPFIVTEAARAINDVPISGALYELAKLSETESLTEPAMFRAVNANYRLGIAESAARLAKVVARSGAAEIHRVQALEALANWQHPSGRDRITGLWRPAVGIRENKHAAEALGPIIADILNTAPDRVRAAAANAAAALGLNAAAPQLAALAAKEDASAPSRIAALRALAAVKSEQLSAALEAAGKSSNEELRREVVRLQAASGSGASALARLEQTIEKGSVSEQQAAFSALTKVQDAAADQLLVRQLERLEKGELPRELILDVLEAALARPSVKPRVEALLAKQPAMMNSASSVRPCMAATAKPGAKSSWNARKSPAFVAIK